MKQPKEIFNKNLIFSHIQDLDKNSEEIVEVTRIYLDIGVSVIMCDCLESIKTIKKTFKNALVLPNNPIKNKDEVALYHSMGASMVLLENNATQDEITLKEIINLCKKLLITPILNITNHTNAAFIAESLMYLQDVVVIIDCKNIYDSFMLKTKIEPHIKTILKNDIKSINDAYIAANLGFNGIFCEDILKKGGGKFINSLQLTFKGAKAKKNTFYYKLFDKLAKDSKITQIRGEDDENFSIDEILRFSELDIDGIAFYFSYTNIGHLKNTLKLLNKINKNIIKIGIVQNNKRLFQIQRNFQDNGILDVLEIENIDIFKKIKKGNFAFYLKDSFPVVIKQKENFVTK